MNVTIMPLHPAWVKNISRRVLWAALEKDISRADRVAMAEFFEYRCAYCDCELNTRWHADHLLPVDLGGCNHLSNRVPACPRCNEVEKREMPWEQFLNKKADGNDEAFHRRKERIEKWVSSRKLNESPVTDQQREVWKAEVDQLAKAIDDAWTRLRKTGLER